jgi:pyridoxine 5'-phosphate synthase PdxJ
MKLSQTLEGNELSRQVLTACEDISHALVGELVDKYCCQLSKNGEHIPDEDIKRIKSFLLQEMNIKMTMSASITPKKIEEWDIAIIDAKQSFFSVPEGEKA